MMMPSVFAENLFDEFMNYPFGSNYVKKVPMFAATPSKVMKTDVKEMDEGYELTMDLPGIKKEDISAQLDRGYLTVRVTQNAEDGEKDDKGNYIRRERCSGNMSRSFYVGEHMEQEDIHAKFENGTLILDIPKKPAKEVENKATIAIEG